MRNAYLMGAALVALLTISLAFAATIPPKEAKPKRAAKSKAAR